MDEEQSRLPIAPRPEVLWFAGEMEEKLREHDHKDKWTSLTQQNLLKKLENRSAKLNRAVMERASNEEQIKHATNVANFAMMIADNAAQAVEDKKHCHKPHAPWRLCR